MRIRDVQWPPGILEKVEVRHGLLRDQVESAVLEPGAYLRKVGKDRYFVFGMAEDGSYIISVVALHTGIARVISARRMTMQEQGTYRRRGK
jgi:uncharacterized DUF497 family protein